MTTLYYEIDQKSKTNIAKNLLNKFGKEVPTIICLGSDKVLSDMVGVLVADILKANNLKTDIYGGKNSPILQKDVPNILAKTGKNVLFVDSGCLSQGKVAFCTNGIKLFDKEIYVGASLVANTIELQNGKILLANCKFQQILDFAKFFSESILLFQTYSRALSINVQIDKICANFNK